MTNKIKKRRNKTVCFYQMYKIFLIKSESWIHRLLKGILHFFFLEIGSFYHSPRVKLLGFTVFECTQTIFFDI